MTSRELAESYGFSPRWVLAGLLFARSVLASRFGPNQRQHLDVLLGDPDVEKLPLEASLGAIYGASFTLEYVYPDDEKAEAVLNELVAYSLEAKVGRAYFPDVVVKRLQVLLKGSFWGYEKLAWVLTHLGRLKEILPGLKLTPKAMAEIHRVAQA